MKKRILNVSWGTMIMRLGTRRITGLLLGCLLMSSAHAIPVKFDIKNGMSNSSDNPLIINVLLDGGGKPDTPLYQMSSGVKGQDPQADYVVIVLDQVMVTSYQIKSDDGLPDIIVFDFDFTALSGFTLTFGNTPPSTKPTGSFELRFDVVLEGFGIVRNVVHFTTPQQGGEVMAGDITSGLSSFTLPVATTFTDPDDFDPALALFSGTWTADFVPFMIDIKPGSDPNSINPRKKGVIPVAVLGSVDFDATQVDVTTVEFGPDGATPAHDGHVEDVNTDGFADFVVHFEVRDTGIVCGDTDATLAGETSGSSGSPFTGTDAVKTVGCE